MLLASLDVSFAQRPKEDDLEVDDAWSQWSFKTVLVKIDRPRTLKDKFACLKAMIAKRLGKNFRRPFSREEVSKALERAKPNGIIAPALFLQMKGALIFHIAEVLERDDHDEIVRELNKLTKELRCVANPRIYESMRVQGSTRQAGKPPRNKSLNHKVLSRNDRGVIRSCYFPGFDLSQALELVRSNPKKKYKGCYKWSGKITHELIAAQVTLCRNEGSTCSESCIQKELKDWELHEKNIGGKMIYDPIVMQESADKDAKEAKKPGAKKKLDPEKVPKLIVEILFCLFCGNGTRSTTSAIRKEYGTIKVVGETSVKEYINDERKEGSILHYLLRHEGKLKRRKYLRAQQLKRGEFKYEDLPECIKKKWSKKAFELDRIIGSDGGNLVTLGNKKFRFLLISPMMTNTTQECVEVVEEMIKDYDCDNIITDRGSEMALLMELFSKFQIKITKCDAANPQQKGQIENMNGELRGMGVRVGMALKDFSVFLMLVLQWCKSEKFMQVLNDTCPMDHVHKIMKVCGDISLYPHIKRVQKWVRGEQEDELVHVE